MSEARALVTGASAGIGKEFAVQLASSGKDLVLVARRLDALQALATQLHEDYNVAVDVLQCDLSLPGAPAKLHQDVLQRGIEVDMLINNAGANGPDLLNKRDWPAQQRYIELMMTSVAAMCHFFIPVMQARGYGRVVNVASVAGLFTAAGDYSYGPTKAYLVALSKGLAASISHQGVNVTALCPGFTHTEFHASEALTKMKKSTPDFIWYDVDVVVREALAAVEKGKPVMISGRLYRFLIPVLRTRISQWVVARMGVRKDW